MVDGSVCYLALIPYLLACNSNKSYIAIGNLTPPPHNKQNDNKNIDTSVNILPSQYTIVVKHFLVSVCQRYPLNAAFYLNSNESDVIMMMEC